METPGFTIREYQPKDRQTIRDLCCQTGFLGGPIDPVFEDRDLFADFLTDYYLLCEPDSAFVVTVDNAVKGYLLGCRFPRRHQIFTIRQSVSLGAKTLFRLPRYQAESRRYIRWIALYAWQEVPEAPRNVGHFHMNFLPEVKRIAVFRAVLERYLRFLADHGVKQISAQMVTFDERRTLHLFERYGFRVLNRSRISKFERFTSESVYLSTIVKDIVEKDGRVLYQVAPGAHRAKS
ncbi:MAG: GNAT family acetyltransferase [Verrucomicrobia bacterium]|nr:GNAT family acetyltransferase [Verrucomicrobiota bacterium]MBV8482061.1 GNAT family acetyltransferase [Verrucomicrobiota bacterium]